MNATRSVESAAPAFVFGNDSAVLRKIVDKAAVSMVVASMDGHVLYTNAAFESGFRLISLGGGSDRLSELFALDDVAADLAITRLVGGAAEDYKGEHLCHSLDGTSVWASLEVSVLRSETGAARYLIVQLINIEGRKRSEEALAASEGRWKFALEGARQGVWDHDARTGTMYHAPMWREIRGLSALDPVIGNRDAWLERIHPADRDRVRAHVDRQEQGIDGYDVLEYRERHRDGHYVWILSRGKPVAWDAAGKAVRTIGTDSDISHLKAVEAQLAEEKERWRITLEAIGDAIISTDAQGRVRFMNGVASTLTGWSLSEATDSDLAEVLKFVGKDQTAIRVYIADCLNDRAHYVLPGDPVIVSRSNTTYDVRCSFSPIIMPDGEASGVVLVIQDVTEALRRRRQLEYEASHDALTGLANRAEFERVSRTAAVTGQHHLLFLDLNRFKQINDAFGHATGDRVLCEVGAAIQGSVRRQDLCSRIGGDEFAVLLRDCNAESKAREIGLVVAAAVRAVSAGGGCDRIFVGVAIGVARLDSHTPLDRAMADADASCYAAKRGGPERQPVDPAPAATTKASDCGQGE